MDKLILDFRVPVIQFMWKTYVFEDWGGKAVCKIDFNIYNVF